jgi:hypothetical protein
VSGFPRPWVRIPPSPPACAKATAGKPTEAARFTEDLSITEAERLAIMNHMGKTGLPAILLACLVIILVGFALTPPAVSLSDLRMAPERIEISGTEYTLTTYLQRDFMPFCPPDGRPLGCGITIKGPGETAISSRIDATRLWAVKGEEVWVAELAGEERSTTGDTLRKGAGGGPKWEPGISVDVIVRIIDLESGKDYLLRASNQEIYRTS